MSTATPHETQTPARAGSPSLDPAGLKRLSTAADNSRRGHNIAGNALCDHGLTIDFSAMRQVRVDAQQQRAYVEPGATLADFDRAVQAHGLAAPVGINSTTGIAGLTLGGGFGWLTRKYGLSVDNLVSVEAVTAEGQRLRASEGQNADLFWALRGGGGNFAVVTQFEFKLHRVGPEVLAGLIVFPFEQARQVLKQYRDFVASAPEELNVHGRWEQQADDERCMAWARAFFQAAAPYASEGAYVNFLTEEESDRVAAAYGANRARLAQIKQQYDPHNLFHLNQNIKPSARQGH